jgi:hypothetical protein
MGNKPLATIWRSSEIRFLTLVLGITIAGMFYFAPPPIVQLAFAGTGSCTNSEDPCTGPCCPDSHGNNTVCCNPCDSCCNAGCCAQSKTCIGDGLQGEICCPAGNVGCNGSCCNGSCLTDDCGGKHCCAPGETLCGTQCVTLDATHACCATTHGDGQVYDTTTHGCCVVPGISADCDGRPDIGDIGIVYELATQCCCTYSIMKKPAGGCP